MGVGRAASNDLTELRANDVEFSSNRLAAATDKRLGSAPYEAATRRRYSLSVPSRRRMHPLRAASAAHRVLR